MRSFIYGVLFSSISSAFSYGFTIQNVSGPEGYGTTVIRRYVAFEQGGKAKYGRCDVIEDLCLPDSESFELLRETTFENYQTQLAKYFDIEPKYLLFDDKMSANFDATKKLLRNIIDAESVTPEEKNEAQQKFDKLTEKGGIIDRFTQARAIKRSMKWDPENPERNLVNFEKSQKQFLESARPFDFVVDVKATNPREIFEPSTEKTWAFGGNALNRFEAGRACDALGDSFSLPTRSEWSHSREWITKSTIGDAVNAEQANKMVWLRDVEFRELRFTVEKFLSQYATRPVSVVEVQFRPEFLAARFTGTVYNIDGSQNWTTRPSDSEAIDDDGRKTPKYSVICVSADKAITF